ncbi:MAG: DDE-type integrase/transposase/recombinase [Actinomycetota bacterium]|nr:DDE-type integrase/transposase/recombinase [Actinomycetota bacterium]
MKLTRAEREQLAQTLRCAQAEESFDAALVRDIAAGAGVSERYVYSLTHDGVPARTRAPWQLTDHAIELYYEKRAKLPAVHAALVEAGEDVPALRQLQCAFATQLDSDERAFVRWGAAQRRAASGTVRWEARCRNAIWQTDHVQLGVPVVLPGRPTRPKCLAMTYFIDCYSRMVMGWMISARESSDAVLEALRDAILIDPEAGSPHGGKPLVLMYDNGKTFIADVVQQAAALLGFRTQSVARYSPHQNGKVERCHQTICALALSEMPAWKHGPRDVRGRLFCDTPVTEEVLIAEVDAAVRHYNFERPHGAIGGLTPWQRFCADETALRVEDPARLRFALRHRKLQTVQPSGVWKHGRYYWAPALDTRGGDPAIVAWLRKDERSLYEGGWVVKWVVILVMGSPVGSRSRCSTRSGR